MDKKDFEVRERLKQAMINNPDGLIDSVYAVLTMVFEIRSEAFEMAKQELDTIKWEDAGFCPNCGQDTLRGSIDAIDFDDGILRLIRYCGKCMFASVVTEASSPESEPR